MEDYVKSKMNNLYEYIPTVQKLLNEKELKSIIEQWKRFAEAIAANNHLEDYKKCIQWEKKLLLEFHKRDKDNRFDWLIKLIRLDYERALSSYQLDFSLNEDYFHFLRSLATNDSEKKVDEATAQLKRMITLFPNRLELFRFAANWYYRTGDICEAKNVLFQGIKHSKNDNLYVDVLDLLMNNWNHPDFSSDIHKLVDVMTENNARIELFKGLIETLENMGNKSVSDVLIDYVIATLTKEYRDEPETYYLIALRELKGKHCPSTVKVQQTTDAAIDRCNKIFKRGIKILSEGKKKFLWKLYLDTFAYIAKEYSNTATENMLKQALKDSDEIPGLEYDMHLIKLYLKYFPYREIIINNKLEEAASSDTTTLPLWITCITYLLSKSFNEKKIKTALDKGSEVLGKEVIKLYDLYFTYLEINFPEYAELEYKKVLVNGNLHEDVLGDLKVRYLSYSILKVRDYRDPKQTKDIVMTYNLYKELASSPPYHRDLHTEIIRAAETCIENEDTLKILDEALDLWKEQFGTSDPDPYLLKIERIMYHNSEESTANTETDCRLNELYQEAIHKLNETAKENFIQSYNEKVKFYKQLEANNGSPPQNEDTDYSESELGETGNDEASEVQVLE